MGGVSVQLLSGAQSHPGVGKRRTDSYCVVAAGKGRRLSYIPTFGSADIMTWAMGQGREWKCQAVLPTTISVSLMMLVVEAQLLTCTHWHSLVGRSLLHQAGNGRPVPWSSGPTIPAGVLDAWVLLGRNERLSVYLGGIRVAAVCSSAVEEVPLWDVRKVNSWLGPAKTTLVGR